MAWEKAFIEYMQNYSKTEMPDFMDVAFYSERSIEDELDRTSKSEISTIVISYLVMFLYLRSSLGSWSGSCSTLLVSILALNFRRYSNKISLVAPKLMPYFLFHRSTVN